MPEYVRGGVDLAGAELSQVRTLLGRLRQVPALADRYAGVEVSSLADLATVPVMTKDDLQVALAARPPRAAQGATWMFQSGGTTGSPQVGYAPTGLYMADVYAHWRALEAGDVFVNGWAAGKMWGAHFLVNSYADLAGCLAMNLGTLSPEEYGPWLSFFAERKVTAYGGTTSVLRLLFAHARDAGITLPDLRKVLWLGEAWSPQLSADLAAVAPNARRWGMFGSTETWVVGTNTPACPADMWHPLPTQLVTVDSSQLLDFTCLSPSVLNPILRYRTGDAGELVECGCGRDGPAFRVLGRRDQRIKFRGVLIDVTAVLSDLDAQPGVARSQLVVREAPDGRDVLEVLLQATGRDATGLPDRIRALIVGSGFGPSDFFQAVPDSLQVKVVDALIGNERTGKVPPLVVLPAT